MTPSADPRIGDPFGPTGHPAVAYYPPGASDGPRVLPSFEFRWVLQGVVEWERDGLRRVVSPGTLVLLRPGVPHRFTFDARRPTRMGYVQFDLDERLAGTGEWPETRLFGLDDPIRGLIRYLLWLGGRQPEGWRPRARDVLALLLTVFRDGPLPDQDDGAELPAALDPILDHVRAAWASGPLRPLTRNELARAGAMSPGHLSRLFREHCGVGAVAAFELLRLIRAEDLLRRSTMSVRSIAAACGFADPYHFSHRFKAAYGISPRTFRDGAAPVSPAVDAAPKVRLLAHRIWGTSGPMHGVPAAGG